MAPLLAPYNSAMRLGSGFNSYTQQLRLHGAVKKGTKPSDQDEKQGQAVNQAVVWNASVIDKMKDVTDSLNISGALTIKYNNLIDGNGNGTFINSNKLQDSDINFLLTVKVINQTVKDDYLTEFSPIENLDPSMDFTQVYGDTFISGFQEGGEFNALVSIKVKDKTQKENIKAEAEVALTTPGTGSSSKPKNSSPKSAQQSKLTKNEEGRTANAGKDKDKKGKAGEEGGGDGTTEEVDNDDEDEGDGEDKDEDEAGTESDASGVIVDDKQEEEKDTDPAKGSKGSDDHTGLTLEAEGKVQKYQHDILRENEVTISVSYTGGGQDLKAPDDDWNIQNLRRAALRFPSLVAKNPVRTNAVLSEYTSLRSYYAKMGKTLAQPHKAQAVLGEVGATSWDLSSQPASRPVPHSYSNTGLFTAALQEAFLQYKNIIKDIHILENDVDTGVKKLKESTFKADESPSPEGQQGQTTPQKEQADSPSGMEALQPGSRFVDSPFAPTLMGLEKARFDARRMMDLIIKEVDRITLQPQLASAARPLPCQDPLIFKQYLPIGVPSDEFFEE